MKRTILQTAKPVFLTILFMHALHAPVSFASKGPTAEKIVEELKKKKIQKTAEIEKTLVPESKFAAQIIFIKNKNACPIVAKVFKDFDEFMEEHKLLKTELGFIELVNELRKTCGHALPIISSYQKRIVVEGVGVILLEKAEGQTLAKHYEDLPSMDDARIKKTFTSIGEQLGGLDFLTSTKYNDLVLTHGDSHSGNFTYNEPTNQLYWIDTSGLSFKPGPCGLKYFQTIDTLSNPVLFLPTFNKLFTSEVNFFSPSKIRELNLSPEEAAEAEKIWTDHPEALKFLPKNRREAFISDFKPIVKIIQNRVLALKSLGEGYCVKNPRGKYGYNELASKWLDQIKMIHRIEQVLGLPETPFVDPVIH